jgi:transitional endoplasmic reticulum ATPase
MAADLEQILSTLMAQSQQGKSSDQLAREEVLARLDQLGARVANDESVVYEGTRIVLPTVMEGNLSEAIKYLSAVKKNEEEAHEFSRDFPYRPWDGAAAFSRAMQRVFGTSGTGKATFSFFGKQPPRLISIPVGLNQQIQVPWGEVSFSQLDATFELGASMSDEHGLVFQLSVVAPRKHRRRIEGFMDVVGDELAQRSIYRGQMINAAEHPGFINPYSVRENQVVYSEDVMTQLRANLWTVIEHAEWYRNIGKSLKRAVLLEGPYGSGKSLAGVLTAQRAVQNGWTFILVRGGEDPYAALKTARLYAPAVVWVEDIDVLVANKPREEVTRLLDALDSVSNKGAEVVAGYTTNFAGVIDRAVLRPGRLDAVIHIGKLDTAGIERLIRASIPGQLLGDIDYSQTGEAFDGFLPAFVVEAAERAIRYAVARTDGHPDVITTDDLVNAAEGLRPQLDMSSAAGEAAHGTSSIETHIEDSFVNVLGRAKFAGYSVEVEGSNGKR